ncbi:hypothetical protein BC940DRAFT_329010 [Gongronella butleri]|nr:hypothetical protein BC940DRAFT_329010 [Gongronella butleri]
MPTLSDLPDELVRKIIEALPLHECPGLRLVGRSFSRAAADIFFSKQEIAITSLDKLQCLFQLQSEPHAYMPLRRLCLKERACSAIANMGQCTAHLVKKMRQLQHLQNLAIDPPRLILVNELDRHFWAPWMDLIYLPRLYRLAVQPVRLHAKGCPLPTAFSTQLTHLQVYRAFEFDLPTVVALLRHLPKMHTMELTLLSVQFDHQPLSDFVHESMTTKASQHTGMKHLGLEIADPRQKEACEIAALLTLCFYTTPCLDALSIQGPLPSRNHYVPAAPIDSTRLPVALLGFPKRLHVNMFYLAPDAVQWTAPFRADATRPFNQYPVHMDFRLPCTIVSSLLANMPLEKLTSLLVVAINPDLFDNDKLIPSERKAVEWPRLCRSLTRLTLDSFKFESPDDLARLVTELPALKQLRISACTCRWWEVQPLYLADPWVKALNVLFAVRHGDPSPFYWWVLPLNNMSLEVCLDDKDCLLPRLYIVLRHNTNRYDSSARMWVTNGHIEQDNALSPIPSTQTRVASSHKLHPGQVDYLYVFLQGHADELARPVPLEHGQNGPVQGSPLELALYCLRRHLITVYSCHSVHSFTSYDCTQRDNRHGFRMDLGNPNSFIL